MRDRPSKVSIVMRDGKVTNIVVSAPPTDCQHLTEQALASSLKFNKWASDLSKPEEKEGEL